MRLPELDQKAVEVQPLPVDRLSNGLSQGNVDINESHVERDMNRDLLDIPMFGYNGSECCEDPGNRWRSRPKNHISEFCRFREVDRSRAIVDCRRR